MKKLQLSLKRGSSEDSLKTFSSADSQGSPSESMEGSSNTVDLQGATHYTPSAVDILPQFCEQLPTHHGEELYSSHLNCNTGGFCGVLDGEAMCPKDTIHESSEIITRSNAVQRFQGQEFIDSQVFTSERYKDHCSHNITDSLRMESMCASSAVEVELHQMKECVSVKRQTSLLSYFQKSPSRGHRKTQISTRDHHLSKVRPPLPLLQTPSSSAPSSSQPHPRSAPFIPVVLPSSLSLHNSKPVNRTSHSSNRTCPFYKIVPGTSFTVDAFSYGSIPNCSFYFLSHFHSDHYMGLTRKFHHPIYCSKITANLVKRQLKVSMEYVNTLHMNMCYILDGVEVIFLDANHCPGSVMILFKLSSGKNYLHTGDFRFCDSMLEYGPLLGISLTQLFLDTTYCSPQYDFPKQDDVIAFVVDKVLTTLESHPNTLIVCGTYTIGKERVFMAIAEALDQSVCVYKEKKAILDCLENMRISSSITTDSSASIIHVLPMARLTLESLTEYLGQFMSKYTTLLAFKPTGWTHSKTHINMGSIKPLARGPVTIYGVPYSEHSSFSELRKFVQFARPQKILPTVNNFSAKKRQEMQRTFELWLSKSRSPPKWKQRTLSTTVMT